MRNPVQLYRMYSFFTYGVILHMLSFLGLKID